MSFHTAADELREESVRLLLNEAWNVELLPALSEFSPFDFECGQGVVELKSRNISSTQFRTVFFALRKYLSLVPEEGAVFVVQFLDCIKWIKVKHCGGYERRMGGHANPRAKWDTEMMIEVDIADMLPIELHPW